MKRAIFIFVIALLLLGACAKVEKRAGTPTVGEGEEQESAEIGDELNGMIADIDNVNSELDLETDVSQEITLG